MTLASTTPRVQYNGDGATVSFPVTFTFWSAKDLRVILLDADGVTETIWTNGSEYTVSGGSGSTGTVTVSASPTDYTPASGETLTIRSNLAYSQLTSIPLGGSLPSTAIEQQDDKIVRMVQQLEEAIGRSLLLPESSATSDLILPEPDASKVIGWNSAGTSLENKTPNESAYLSVTAFAETLIDDADAATARATLGAQVDLDVPSQAEAEAGTATTERVWTAQLVAQAVAALSLKKTQLLTGGYFTLNPWQRGTSFTAATTFPNNDAVYLADQWVLLSDGNDIVDVSKDTDGSLLATVATANKQFGFVHIVRADNAAAVMGDVISAAVNAKASGIGTLRMAVLTWDGTADACTRDVVATWAGGGTEPTWATNWTREGSVVDLTLGASFATQEAENVSLDTASGKQFAVVVWIDDTDASVSDTLNIKWVSAIPGSTHPTLPPYRLASGERALCRSEFRLLANGTDNAIGLGYQIDGTNGVVFLDISMSEVPTLTISSAGHFTFFPDSVVATALTANTSSTTEIFGIDITVASGFAANDSGALQSSNASALLYLTCEL